jgi:hypothetical protein
MRTMTNRPIAAAAATLIALSTIGLQPASAGWRHSDEAVALGVFGAVLGTIAGVIAAEHAREQPVFVPGYPYGGHHDGYRRSWRHHDHFEDQDRWRHEER